MYIVIIDAAISDSHCEYKATLGEKKIIKSKLVT